MMMLKRVERLRNRDEGFTLIELLVCIIILSVIIIPLTAVLIDGLQTTATVNSRLDNTNGIQSLARIWPADAASTDPAHVNDGLNYCGTLPADGVRIITLAWNVNVTSQRPDALEKRVVEYDGVGVGGATQIIRWYCQGNDTPKSTIVARGFGWSRGGANPPSKPNYSADKFAQASCDSGTLVCKFEINNFTSGAYKHPLPEPGTTDANHNGVFQGTMIAQERTSSATGSATAPLSPQNLTATPDNCEVELSWSPPSFAGNLPITGYEVEVTQTQPTTGNNNCPAHAPYTAPYVVPFNAFTTSTPLTGLDNYAYYKFRVRAKNASYTGAWSDYTVPVMPRPGPPHPPSSLIATKTPGVPGLSVSWALPTNDGGSALTSLTLTGDDTTDTNGSRKFVIVIDCGGGCAGPYNVLPATQSSVGLTGNAPLSTRNNGDGLNWVFSMTASSALGTSSDSPSSAPTLSYGKPDPTQIVSATNDPQTGSVTVTWDNTNVFDGGSPLTSFDAVQMQDDGTGHSNGTVVKDWPIFDATAKKAVVSSTLPPLSPVLTSPGGNTWVPPTDGLDPGKYIFAVQAQNLDGGADISHAGTTPLTQTGRIADPVDAATVSSTVVPLTTAQAKCPLVPIPPTNDPTYRPSTTDWFNTGTDCQLVTVTWTQPRYDGLQPPANAGWDNDSNVSLFKLRLRNFSSSQCLTPEEDPSLPTCAGTKPPGIFDKPALYRGVYPAPWLSSGGAYYFGSRPQPGQNGRRVFVEDCDSKKAPDSYASGIGSVVAPWYLDAGSAEVRWGCSSATVDNGRVTYKANIIMQAPTTGTKYDMFVSAVTPLGDGAWTKLPLAGVAAAPPNAPLANFITPDLTAQFATTPDGIIGGSTYSTDGGRVALRWCAPYQDSSTAATQATCGSTAGLTTDVDHFTVTSYDLQAHAVDCGTGTEVQAPRNLTGTQSPTGQGYSDAPPKVVTDSLGHSFPCYQFRLRATNRFGTSPWSGWSRTWDLHSTCTLPDSRVLTVNGATKLDGNDGWVDYFPGDSTHPSRQSDVHYADPSLRMRFAIGGTSADSAAHLRFDARPNGASCMQSNTGLTAAANIQSASLTLFNVNPPKVNVDGGNYTVSRDFTLYRATDRPSWVPQSLRYSTAPTLAAAQSRGTQSTFGGSLTWAVPMGDLSNARNNASDPGFMVMQTGGTDSYTIDACWFLGISFCTHTGYLQPPYAEATATSWWGGNGGSANIGPVPVMKINFY